MRALTGPLHDVAVLENSMVRFVPRLRAIRGDEGFAVADATPAGMHSWLATAHSGCGQTAPRWRSAFTGASTRTASTNEAAPACRASSMRWASTSVSVCDEKWRPEAMSRSRSSRDSRDPVVHERDWAALCG